MGTTGSIYGGLNITYRYSKEIKVLVCLMLSLKYLVKDLAEN